MSLLAVFGTHAIGKTTFLRNSMDALADVSKYDLRIVLADITQEFYLTPDKQSWLKKRQQDWQGSRAVKAELLKFCIEDDAMWIVESAWCFRGMQKELLELDVSRFKFIIPITEAEILKKFIMDRCESQGKTFRSDYWDAHRLEYEGKLRYTNFIKKHMQPAGVESCIYHIYEERAEWDVIFQQLVRWLQ